MSVKEQGPVRKTAALSVVTMVLPHELSVLRLIKSEFSIRLKLSYSHFWGMVHTDISASGGFLTCWQMVKGATAWKVPCGEAPIRLRLWM